jgi:hypothetical protein
MRGFLLNLEKIDRRWVYLALAAACTMPFLVPVALPIYITPETRGVYSAIESCPPDKIVLLNCNMDPGSVSENQGQLEAVIEHMFRNHTKFVTVSIEWGPLAPQLIDGVVEKMTKGDKLTKAKFPDVRYGVDWANLGFTKGGWQALQQVAKDIRKQYPTKDSRGNMLDDLPIMRGLHNIDDVHLVVDIAYGPMEDWIPFVHGVYGTPIAFGSAGINTTVYYRYLSSGQLAGLLVGVRGGAEYDALLHPRFEERLIPGTQRIRNMGSQLIVPLAFGHVVIIAAILLGNIGYFASRRRRRQNAE